MMRHWFGRLGAWLMIVMVCARGAGAVPMQAEPSVEWQVEASALVVRGTVRPGMQRDLVVEGRALREVTLDVKEVIKGEAGEQIVFWMSPDEPLAGATQSWEDVLVFLNRVEGEVKANVPSARLGAWRAPQRWVFMLAQSVRGIYQMDGTYVRDAAGLVALARDSAKFARERGGKCESQSFALDTTVWDPGGAFVIVAPKDARLEAVSRRWLEDQNPDLRARGLAVISGFRSKENAGRVRKLLADGFSVEREAGEWTAALAERWWREYPLRRQAGAQLAKWNELNGARVDAMVPDPRYAAVGRAWAWGLAVGVIGAVALGWPRRGWGRRRWGRLGRGARLAMVMVGLMVLVAVAWPRGRDVNAYSAAVGEADYEVVSSGGRVALLRVQDQAAAHGWRVWRYARPQTGDALWFTRLLTPVESFEQGGFYAAEGRTAGSGGYSYRLVVLPFWMVMAGLAVLPAIWGVGWIKRSKRRRRWVNENRCGRCGYDLRGRRVDEACPQCGEDR